MTTPTKNPFTWVEIYVEDMNRAQQFYEAVLDIKMVNMVAPGDFGDLEMLSFPWDENERNISGALCKTKDMKPGPGGTLVYFSSEDCVTETSRITAAGGQVIQPKFQIGEHGFIAIVMDTEGNTIGFHSIK